MDSKHRKMFRAALMGLGLCLSGQPAIAAPADPHNVCVDPTVVSALKAQMRTWALQQDILAHRVDRDDVRNDRVWSIREPRVLLGLKQIEPGWAKFENNYVYACQADFEYVSTTAGAGLDRARRFKIKDVRFAVTSTVAAPTQYSVRTPTLPTSINTDAALLSMKDQISFGDVSLAELVEKQRGVAKSQPAAPRNVIEGWNQIGQQYQSELETEMRRQGMGDILDAEKARRAKLTPAERAAEDTWNRGPARGETMCRQENGITRCKTGQ